MAGERFLIAPGNLMDSRYATVVATSELTTASNLLSTRPTDWFIAEPTGLQITLELDLDVGQGWDFIAPLYTNFGPSCTWQARAATTEGGLLTPTFQTDPIPGQLSSELAARSYDWSHSLAWSGSPEWLGQGRRTERWIRIDVTTVDPKLPQGFTGDPYVQWGALVVAEAWRPPYSVAPQFKVRWDERPRVDLTAAGAPTVGARRRPRKASYLVDFLTRQEAMTYFDELGRLVGASVPVVTIFDPLDLENIHREFIYGTLDVTDRVHRATDVYQKAINIKEAWA